jgi:hypothetical protein
MQAHRLRAPKADGAILAEPPIDHASAILHANVARFAGWDHDFQGRRADILKALVRTEAIEAARRYHEGAGIDFPTSIDVEAPFVVTGHQPELFHPGVWVKNFAIAGLARAVGGTAINMIVDNDIPKGAYARVPERTPAGLRPRLVAFDDWTGEAPFEDQQLRDPTLFESFPRHVHTVLNGLVANPLLDRFWSHVLSAPEGMPERDRVGRRFARARRLVEDGWGFHNLEVPLSDLCETDGFRWFACHLLAQLGRFHAVHNEALERYRALYHIRSKNHPVAALGRQGDWLEAPLWVWRENEPRRRPLLVRQVSRRMELRIGGEDAPFIELPLAPDREACCAVEALRKLPEKGIRLRTRALTTTMFARFLLGDLFVHGIGGAKYDELGDEIARVFFRIEPPEFLTLSMTLHLGLPTSDVTPDDLHRVERKLRDLTWQPERFLEGDTSGQVEEKRRLAALVPTSRAERLARYRALRAVNASLTARVADRRAALEAERERIATMLHDNVVARSREFPIILFDEARIGPALADVACAAGI